MIGQPRYIDGKHARKMDTSQRASSPVDGTWDDSQWTTGLISNH
jgi:hypothetical protein